MTQIAVTDRTPVLLAMAGTRIPRRACADMEDLTFLLKEAGRILEKAHQDAEAVRKQSHDEGYAAGVAQAQGDTLRHVLDAQRAAREFLKASEERIVALAVSIVERIAPRLGEADVVAALAAEALKAVETERQLKVRVSAEAADATRELLEQWQQMHPEIETAQIVEDATLPPFACVVETELGHIEAGLAPQLQTVRDALNSVAAQGRR